MKLTYAGKTDVGMIRSGNEDCFAVDANTARGIFIVADGMGGHAAGEVASEMAVTIVLSKIKDVSDLGDGSVTRVLGEALKLTDATWRRLTINYGLFFIALAVINLGVWLASDHGYLTDGQFVFFRFPGVPILAVLFSFSQVPLMMKDMKAQEEAEVLPPPPPAD